MAAKDAYCGIMKDLREREDEINSISLRLFRVEQDNIDLNNVNNDLNNKIRSLETELDNHSH